MGNTASKIHKAVSGRRNRHSHTVRAQSDGAESEHFTDEIDKQTMSSLIHAHQTNNLLT